MQLTVTSGTDWFDVEGKVEFDGRWVKFPAILEAVSRGERFVPLSDGSSGLISEEMIERVERLGNWAQTDGEAFRFSSSQALLLNALLENEQGLKADQKFKNLRKKIRSFSGVAALKPAASFSGKLRKYQREGLGWLKFLESFGFGGILADDMGLGKTVQCLAYLDLRKFERTGKTPLPSVLVAPKSLLDNWKAEALRFTPNLRVLVHAGALRVKDAHSFDGYDLIVMTYQTLLRDIEVLKETVWDCVIADEAQAIKNPEALVSRAVKSLPSKFRLAMTGTPIENSLEDLFSISNFVNPGFLSGKRKSPRFDAGSAGRKILSDAFRPVLLRRTKEKVLKDLPEKTEQTIFVDLESKQMRIYNELKRFYQGQLLKDVRLNGVNKSSIQILAALTRLRQAALHPGLIEVSHAGEKSSKFELALDMLDEIISEGHRVLIFSQFTKLLALFKSELNLRNIEFAYLDGQTRNRKDAIAGFKESNVPVFLISLKAGGVGLNLVEADYVFLLDPWWNPAVEAQAIDRVHRIGQKRAVNAYRFIAKATVEEKIMELQQSKRGLMDDIVSEKSASIRNLSLQDIEGLFA
jgi:SNF2 family DNA or RNA helicase